MWSASFQSTVRQFRRFAQQGRRNLSTEDASEGAKKGPKTIRSRLHDVYYAPILVPLVAVGLTTTLVSNSKDCRELMGYISPWTVDMVRKHWGIAGEDPRHHLHVLSTLEEEKQNKTVKVLYKDGTTRSYENIPGSISVSEFKRVHIEHPDRIVDIDFSGSSGDGGGYRGDKHGGEYAYGAPSAITDDDREASYVFPYLWAAWALPTATATTTTTTSSSSSSSAQGANVLNDRYGNLVGKALSDAREVKEVVSGVRKVDPSIAVSKATRKRAIAIKQCNDKLEALNREKMSSIGQQRSIDSIDEDVLRINQELRKLK